MWWGVLGRRCAQQVGGGELAQNSTAGAVRAASSASKYSRRSNLSILAKYTVGNCWSLLL